MSSVQDYLKSNKQRQLDELLEFLKIPSVSADPQFAKEVRRTAEFVKILWIKQEFQNLKFMRRKVIQ